MDKQDLNERCIGLMNREPVRNHMWHAPMFWEVGDLDNPVAGDLTRPKVDLCELEVMLSTAAHEQPECARELDEREPGRAGFIMRQVRRGDTPLLRHA